MLFIIEDDGFPTPIEITGRTELSQQKWMLPWGWRGSLILLIRYASSLFIFVKAGIHLDRKSVEKLESLLAVAAPFISKSWWFLWDLQGFGGLGLFYFFPLSYLCHTYYVHRNYDMGKYL